MDVKNNKEKISLEEKKQIYLENEIYRLDIMNIEKIRDIFYYIKEYNIFIFEKLELYYFEKFIKENSTLYDINDYIETSDEDSDIDDY